MDVQTVEVPNELPNSKVPSVDALLGDVIMCKATGVLPVEVLSDDKSQSSSRSVVSAIQSVLKISMPCVVPGLHDYSLAMVKKEAIDPTDVTAPASVFHDHEDYIQYPGAELNVIVADIDSLVDSQEHDEISDIGSIMSSSNRSTHGLLAILYTRALL